MPHELVRYQRKLSGPILDRIDLYVDVDEVKHSSLLDDSDKTEPSDAIRRRITNARKRQLERYKDPLKTNARLTSPEVKKYIKITPDAQALLNTAAEKLGLSARAYMRLLKVAQSIADLNGTTGVSTADISEALQYRRQTENIM